MSDRFEVESLDIPSHWMRNFFLAHTFLELLLNDQALDLYFSIQGKGLQSSTYLLAQVTTRREDLFSVKF